MFSHLSIWLAISYVSFLLLGVLFELVLKFGSAGRVEPILEIAVNWNFPYVATRRFLSWLAFLLRFLQYLFDLHSDLNQGARFDVGKPYRLAHDRERFLHLVWHCAVYLPVIVVMLVGAVLGADRDDLAFFVAVAAATVSLEICIGIILSKSQGLQNLSRQSGRARKEHANDAARMAGWLKYIALRESAAREGVAKAALITAVSLVLFGSVVGIEAVRLSEHSEAHTREKISHWLESHSSSTELKIDDLMKALGHTNEVSPMLWMAGVMSTCMFFIAFVKLWMQTRSSLESSDAMDRFATPEEAIEAYENDVVFHLLDHAHRRAAENAQHNSGPS